jgi:large subunit ribosomal protein L10
MPLTKSQKATAVDDLVSLLKDSPIVYLTDFAGLTVSQATLLRNDFRRNGVQYKVVKNTLLKRAMGEIGGFDDLFDHLSGPTAVALSTEPAAAARVIQRFTKDNNLAIPELKAAYIDGAVYGTGSIDILALLKSKDEIIGDIAGLLLAPIPNVVGALTGVGSTLVGAIKTISERAES